MNTITKPENTANKKVLSASSVFNVVAGGPVMIPDVEEKEEEDKEDK